MEAPTKKDLTQGEVFALVSDLKQSEQSKTLCGRRLIKIIEG